MKRVLSFIISISIIIGSLVVCYFVFTSRISSTEQYLSAYEKMIDIIVENDTSSFKKADYLAIDASSFYITTEKERQDMVNYMKKYNSTIILANYNMLDNDEFSNNGTLKGILITANNVIRSGNKVTISLDMVKSINDKKTTKFEGTHFNGNWKLKQVN